MLFSGYATTYECEDPDCGFNCANVSPTSIVPMIVTLILGYGGYYQILEKFIDWSVLRIIAAIVITIFSFFCYYQMFEIPSKLYLRKCARCGAKLKVTSNGFYDSIIPQPIELIIYCGVIFTPVVISSFL
jgi:hypothetical protein